MFGLAADHSSRCSQPSGHGELVSYNQRISMVMKYIVPIILLLLTGSLPAQNLVPNGGFETMSTCPSSIGQLNRSVGWDVPSPHYGSSDFFHTCSGGSSGVPVNLFGNIAAHSGNAYIGQYVGYLVTPYEDYREYAQIQLSSPLVAGATYRVEIFISLPNRVGYAVDRYGFYFDSSPLAYAGQLVIPVVPQVESQGTFYTNSTGWDYFTGTFVAVGGEQYLTIGNFSNHLNTTIIPSGITPAGISNPYLYLDDVSVTMEAVLPVSYSYLTAEFVQGDNELKWKTSSEENVTHFLVEHSEDGRSFSQIGEVPAGGSNGDYLFTSSGGADQPSQYYRLKAVDLDGMMHTSKIVVLKGTASGPQVAVFPSFVQAGGTLNLEVGGRPGEVLQWSLLDMAGRKVQAGNSVLESVREVIPITVAVSQAGAYVLQVQVEGEVHNHRILIR